RVVAVRLVEAQQLHAVAGLLVVHAAVEDDAEVGRGVLAVPVEEHGDLVVVEEQAVAVLAHLHAPFGAGVLAVLGGGDAPEGDEEKRGDREGCDHLAHGVRPHFRDGGYSWRVADVEGSQPRSPRNPRLAGAASACPWSCSCSGSLGAPPGGFTTLLS